MSRLHRRISNAGANQAASHAGYHPYGTADTPMLMHMTLVEIGPAGARVTEMTPLVAPDGRMIPATQPGRWVQLYQSGRV